MDHGAHKVLESATFRALHAQNFSRSSSQASLVLTDLLSRYLTLLSSTCAKYAQHAGRTRLTPIDAFCALDELGVSMEELKDYYMTEGHEMNRYSIPSAHLNEFKTQLADGLKQDTDDAFPLYYVPFDSKVVEEDEEDEDAEYEDEEEFELIDTEVNVLGATAPFLRKGDVPQEPPQPPPLPLSPVSNPSSPARKRARTASWRPPSHVPDFLPPFPVPEEPISRPASPTTPHIPQLQLEPLRIDNTPSQVITSSDYLSQVPYAESTLSAVPEWHLPQPPPPPDRERDSSKRVSRLPTPQTEPSFIKAYHHILTHPPPLNHPSNPSRHKVAMALLFQMQSAPRWELPDTLFASVAPCPPRAPSIAPTHPIPIGKTPATDNKTAKPDDKEPKLPGAQPRAVSTTERVAHLISQQPSRIPDLARRVLPPAILARTSRLAHPPVLMRGTQKLVYGNGIPAPWNSAPPPSAQTALVNGKSKDKDAVIPNGKDAEPQTKPVLPDARLFATWEADRKDYRIPLAVPVRNRGRMGSIQSGSGVTLSLSRGKRRDSIL